MKLNHIYKEPQFGEDWFKYEEFYTFIVNKFSSGSHFVEVGCWKGKSSSYMAVEIANSGKKIKFDCVDTWKGSTQEECHIKDKYVENKILYNLFLSNMKPVQSYYTPIRETSKNASKLYKDCSLDFVFIDADHTYEGVYNDIKSWESKIKNGGIIAGHDYNSWPSVTKAVNDYYKNSVIEFQGKNLECNCWYVNK